MILKQKSNRYLGKSSFSLIELFVVIAIIAIFVTMTIPKQCFFSNTILQHEIEHLFTTFSFLQHKAIASNKQQILTFLPRKNSYTYTLGKKIIIHKLPKQAQFGYLQHTKGPPSEPKHNITKPITFIDNKVIFLPSGIISSGTVYLTNNPKTILKAITCPVSYASFVRKYRYTNKKWVMMQ